MSNIIKDDNDFLVLSDFIKYLKSNSLTKESLEEMLKFLIPYKNGELLVSYRVSEKDLVTAMFSPKYNSIYLSVDKINFWLDNNTREFVDGYNIKDIKSLRAYLLLFLLTHEIEHSYQYLIAKGEVSVPDELLRNVYKDLMGLLVHKSYIIPRPIKQIRRTISLILYKLKEHLYVLERNANILSMDLVSKSALYNDNEEMYKMFDYMKRVTMTLGYSKSTDGSIVETYKSLLMYDRYKKIYSDSFLSEEDRVKYGFSISEDTREKILKKI